MILLTNLEKNQGATIEKLSITQDVQNIICARYNNEVALEYAKSVSDFVKQNMRFPEDGIYKISDTDLFLKFNLKSRKWKETSTGKKDYVIDENSNFWEKFDQEFKYLEDFKSEIQEILKQKTTEMFDEKPIVIKYIELIDDKYVAQVETKSNLATVFKEYLDERAVEEFIQKLLKEVYGTNEMPIFVINNGIIDTAITSNKIVSNKKMNNLKPFIKKFFSPKHAEEMYIRLLNVLVYGVDYRDYEFIGHDQYGNPIFKMANLYFAYNDSEKYKALAKGYNTVFLINKKENWDYLYELAKKNFFVDNGGHPYFHEIFGEIFNDKVSGLQFFTKNSGKDVVILSRSKDCHYYCTIAKIKNWDKLIPTEITFDKDVYESSKLAEEFDFLIGFPIFLRQIT